MMQRWLFLVSMMLLLAACGSLPGGGERASPPPPRANLDAVQRALLDQYSDWRGVPYRYGGESRQGLDCSGFAQLTFRERFGIELPRDTSQQQRAGRKVVSDTLAPGDLLFFTTGARSSHVGMYVGNWRFLHVSTSVGVMLSSLRERYWASRFEHAVRLPDL